jgi:drug/metabolite transporter (DMT)-like permease
MSAQRMQVPGRGFGSGPGAAAKGTIGGLTGLSTGTLLTFVQFLFVAAIGLPSQFDSRRPPFFLKPNKVPIRRWLVNIVLFFSINVLNNHAFSYDISVPVHIILRSGGSITTMIAGSLYGKRYSRIQVTAVLLLTVGVITAAWSDAQTKVCQESPPYGVDNRRD